MIGIISPAMNMRMGKTPDICLSRPVMMEKAERIYEELKKLQPWEIQSLMKTNEKIALQAFLDFQDWKKEGGTAAVFAYDGLVFKNVDAGHMTPEELEYLKTTRADEVAEQLKEARSFGDLSENAEYDEAKTNRASCTPVSPSWRKSSSWRSS